MYIYIYINLENLHISSKNSCSLTYITHFSHDLDNHDYRTLPCNISTTGISA